MKAFVYLNERIVLLQLSIMLKSHKQNNIAEKLLLALLPSVTVTRDDSPILTATSHLNLQRPGATHAVHLLSSSPPPIITRTAATPVASPPGSPAQRLAAATSTVVAATPRTTCTSSAPDWLRPNAPMPNLHQHCQPQQQQQNTSLTKVR